MICSHTTIEALRKLATVAQELDNNEISVALGNLAERVERNEWLVLLLGETSAGKSTWVNTLLGTYLLPATSDPTTGIVVEIRFAQVDAPRYTAIARDGARRDIDRHQLVTLCRRPEDTWRLRVVWPLSQAADLPGLSRETLKGLVLVDAPGYNACYREHEQVLGAVLPEADAVVHLLNYRRGFTPEDKQFLDILHNGLRLETPPAFVYGVNWIPPGGGARKIAAMNAALMEQLNAKAELRPLALIPGSEPAMIWSDSLWRDLVDAASATDRADRILRHAAMVGLLFAEVLSEELVARATVNQAGLDELDHIRGVIEGYSEAEKRGQRLIASAQRDMQAVIGRTCSRARDTIWSEVNSAVDEASRFTEASSCGAYVRDHIIPHQVQVAVDRLEVQLMRRTDGLAEELEQLAVGVERSQVPPLRVRNPHWEHVRNAAAERATRRLTEFAFTRYLQSLGGAAGPNAGFVNLAKKVVSKAGRLVGKQFPVEVYYGMGATLRRIGLSASVASAALAAVVIESLAYLYKVVRWKQKLRAVVQRVLGMRATEEPIEDAIIRAIPLLRSEARKPLEELRDDSVTAVGEAMEQTSEIVKKNFGRRAEVLRDALARRGEEPMKRQRELDVLAERMAGILRDLQPHQGGSYAE